MRGPGWARCRVGRRVGPGGRLRGGVRVAAFMHGGFVTSALERKRVAPYTYTNMFHITDVHATSLPLPRDRAPTHAQPRAPVLHSAPPTSCLPPTPPRRTTPEFPVEDWW